jgi:predicted ATPase/class 3 adenylate cyclase
MSELSVGGVTLLFTDVEGSTRLLQRVGDSYAELLEQHRALLRSAFRRWGGVEVDTEGDAFFVAFASAESAVAAGADLQRALAAHPWPDDAEIRVRVGIHTGRARQVGQGYVGLDVHRAARVMAAGHGGQVLLSDATRKQLGAGVSLRDLGEHRLKDLLQPERLFQLIVDGLPAEFPALKTLGNRPNNLPVQPNALIGREAKLADISELVRAEDLRLLTLTGPGGTGKTRLALHAGAELLDDFSSGVFVVWLGPIADPELVVPTIAHALAIRDTPGEDLLATLASYLEEKELLLLLDNFEHVVGAGGAIATLLASCPKLKVLATSRERLRLSVERVYDVPPLAVPGQGDLDVVRGSEAVALFTARAQDARPDFSLSPENAAAVSEICARLDGLPLAIELAAARIVLLTPQALLERLDQRLQLLTGGARDAEPRQRTLRATIEWSHGLLSPAEQVLFARIGVFVGGCRLEAAEALSGTEDDHAFEVLDGLQSLVEQSLVRQRQDQDAEPRFWMLETIREYAVERLRDSGEEHDLRRQHAEHFLALAETAEPELTGESQAAWLDRLSTDLDNFRAALSWFGGTAGAVEELRLAGALWRFWATRGDRTEGRTRLEHALARAGSGATVSRAKALAGAARLASYQEDRTTAERLARERLDVSHELGDQHGIASAMVDLAVLVVNREEGRRLLHEGREIAGRLHDTFEEGRAVANLGALYWEEGDFESAKRFFAEAVPLLEAVGGIRGIAVACNGVGRAAACLEHAAEARPYLERALGLARELNDQHEASLALEGFALLALQNDDAERAATLLANAESMRQSVSTFTTPREQEVFDGALESLRDRLGSAAFERASQRGASLGIDEAAEYALGGIRTRSPTRHDPES